MRKRHEKGMLTVEAAILLPVIFAVIFAIYYMSIMLLQTTAANTMLMRSAARGAVYWEGLGGQNPWAFQYGAGHNTPRLAYRDFSVHDPYRYFFDTKSSTRVANIQSLAAFLNGADPNLLQIESETAPQVSKTGNVLQKYVQVTLSKRFVNPISALFERLGVQVETNRQMSARSPLTNPGEFVRNASFIYDIVKGDD